MKLTKTLFAGFAALSVISAANANTGAINFEGQIVDTPCSIQAGSDNQHVDFGTIALASLNPGDSTPGKTFDIKLTGCDTSTVKTADIAFTGDAGHGDTFGVTGSAKNIGVLITGAKGAIAPGTSDTRSIVDGNNVWTYQASVAADSTAANKVTAGNFSSVANYTITYK